ncbi:MAG: DNA-directed RNA polymerase subunit omega [Magnetococcales bacterium]|nr:DNA-directed RNA polymerase subunit omega [Magnetococcales bacterium]MBF0322840.1 DNA-directed RNA polymerase subunit omega [Magnetococcales bacterium]
MARVTVDDCIQNVPNRFELVILAARRARQLTKGAECTVPLDNDKNTVLALREIGENSIDIQALYQELPSEVEEDLQDDEIDLDARALMDEETRLAGVKEENLADMPAANDAEEEPIVEE